MKPFIAKTRLINIAVILRVLGWLITIFGLFMSLPLAVSLYYGEDDWFAFLIGAGTAVVAGLIMSTAIRPKRSDMGKRDGLLLTAMVWIVFSLFGLVPLVVGSPGLDFTDAFFEAMSEFTTTGVTTQPGLEHFSHGVLFWYALMQWLGGMGIILFTLAVLPMLNYAGGIQMFNAEVTGITHEKLRPRISQTAKSLWGLYVSLTAVLAIALWAGPMSLFDAVCHAMGTVSTGGFSTHNGSIGSFNSIYVNIVVTIFMFLGGVNFVVLYRLIQGKVRQAWSNNVLRALVALIIVYYVVYAVAEIIGGCPITVEDVLVGPLFMVVSGMTSTGYALPEATGLAPIIMLMLLGMAFFGACAGSTSGGAKIDRLLILWQHMRNELYRVSHPNAVRPVRFAGRVLPSELVNKTIMFLCLYMTVILAGVTVLTILGIEFQQGFVMTISCIGNAGNSAFEPIASPADYAALPAVGKYALGLVMLIGRLEVYTILALLSIGFWKK